MQTSASSSSSHPGTPSGPSFFAGAQGFSIGTQVNVGHQNIVAAGNPGLLSLLNPIPDASHTRNRRASPPDSNCLPGTRQEVIKKVVSWVDSSLLLNNCHIIWLYGYVGCGKSAIAQAVAETFAEKKRLAGSYFFFRGSGERSRSARFAATIASQLAAAVPSTARYIEEALRTEAGLLEPSASLSAQFQRLVYDPINAVKWDWMGLNRLRGPFLIILDGLDECEDRDEVAEFIEHSIGFFKKNTLIPLRLFITSRVEEHLRTRLETSQVKMVDLVDHTSLEDIHLALRAAFALAAKHSRVIQSYGDWPSPSDLRQLVIHVGRSFIFMSTVVKFIFGPSEDGLTPITRLPLALNINPGLDGLYAQALSRSQHLPHFFDIIHTIALVKEPLSIIAVADLLQIKVFEVVDVLVNLHAILQVPGDDTTPVTMCHISLHDFLNDKDRSGRFYADPSYHKQLAYCCMRILGAADTNAPAFEYAKTLWAEDHWRPFAYGLRQDAAGRRSETCSLFMHFRQCFKEDYALVLAAYIIMDPELLLGEEVVCNPTRMRTNAGLDDTVLVEFLKSKVPNYHTRLMVKAVNMLRFHRRWDDRRELETIWLDIEPPFPPLASFYHTIVAVGTQQLMKIKFFGPEDGLHIYFSHRDEAPLEPLAFGLAFMSWAETFAFSIQFGPRLNWTYLSDVSTLSVRTGLPSLADVDPVILRLVRFLLKNQSAKLKDRFIASVETARRVALEQEPSGSHYLSELEQTWAWRYEALSGWHFCSTRDMVSYLDVLAAFCVLVMCMERRCEKLHGEACPLIYKDAGGNMPLGDRARLTDIKPGMDA